jgi:hypothetical protein
VLVVLLPLLLLLLLVVVVLWTPSHPDLQGIEEGGGWTTCEAAAKLALPSALVTQALLRRDSPSWSTLNRVSRFDWMYQADGLWPSQGLGMGQVPPGMWLGCGLTHVAVHVALRGWGCTLVVHCLAGCADWDCVDKRDWPCWGCPVAVQQCPCTAAAQHWLYAATGALHSACRLALSSITITANSQESGCELYVCQTRLGGADTCYATWGSKSALLPTASAKWLGSTVLQVFPAVHASVTWCSQS